VRRGNNLELERQDGRVTKQRALLHAMMLIRVSLVGCYGNEAADNSSSKIRVPRTGDPAVREIDFAASSIGR
jgi:hypothetical protein